MSHASPCVTVVIPAYNSAPTLRRAVESVLQQTLTDLELLIVDDGSTDETAIRAIELAAADSRVRVLQQTINRGKPAAMNRAFAMATGRWLAVLDADDWYELERLEVLVATGVEQGVTLVADNQTFHDSSAGIAVRTAFPVSAGDRLLTRSDFISGANPFAAFDYGMLKPIVERAFVVRHGLTYRENVRLSEDFLWLTDFFAVGGAGWLTARPLYNWTQAFGSVSRQWTTTGAGPWRYDYRGALGAHADMANELTARNEIALARLLRRRMRALSILHHLSEVNRQRYQGAPLRAMVGGAMRHPSIWPRLALHALRAARHSVSVG